MAGLMRIVLGAAAAVTALIVARDATNFGVVQGMVSLVLIAATIVVLALTVGRR